MEKAELFKKYPLSSSVVYNGATVIHFLVGGLVISFADRFIGPLGGILGLVYILFSFLDMYVLMPLQVCKNCVYVRLDQAVCISGLNIVARKFMRGGNPSDFPRRARGLLSPNNFYLFSLLFPVACGIPILIFNYSVTLLLLETSLFILLVTRFAWIIPKLACVHCLSKFVCPQAGLMGVREK
jgi:hypothetical protein